MSLPFAAVIIPTLNEEAHIGALLALLVRDAPERVVDILVADGGSQDRTAQIVSEMAAQDPRIRLVANPARLQAAGVNLAARQARPEASILVRIDAHAHYPADYVARLLDAMTASQADSVVVRLVSVGQTCFQRAVAAVSNSPVGTGGSAHRSGGASGFVDHGHHAAFDRATFERVGGYDERFAANEDAELDQRIARAGGRIWFAADIQVDYFPRATPRRLAQQYFRYGRGRAANVKKHRGGLRPRQAIPALLVAWSIAALLATPLTILPLATLGLYLLAVIAAGAWLASRTRDRCVIAAPLAIAIMHYAWGAGFLIGLTDARLDDTE